MAEEERLFTPDEANAELDELRARLPRIREARHALIRASERISEAVATDGGGGAGSDWFGGQQGLKEEITRLAGHGIPRREPETGPVDFPAELDGRRGFPCSRPRQEDIAW